MTIEFYLSKNNSVKNIHLRINIEINPGSFQKFVYNTNLKIASEEWDEEKQRPVNIYLKEHKRINAKLDDLKIKLTEYIKKRYETGKKISQRMLSMEVERICTEKKTIYPELSLLHFTELYIDSKRELISYSTYKRYKVFFHLIKKFEGYIIERLYVDTIEGGLVNKFILFGKKEAYSENTVYRTLHFIRTILNFAERRGIRTAIRELEIRRERQKRELVTLNEAEIFRIKDTHIPKELQAAKDWLLISCYTGQRISDFMEFSVNKMVEIAGKQCISFIQKKTGKSILLPLHETVINVIEQNGGEFPQKLTPTEYNKQIRIIARIVGLKELIQTKKRIGYRSVLTCLEKWQALTSHIGRRSFATIFYGRIPTPLLMEVTGHTTEQMFLQYINRIDFSRILSLSRYFDITYKKSSISHMSST